MKIISPEQMLMPVLSENYGSGLILLPWQQYHQHDDSQNKRSVAPVNAGRVWHPTQHQSDLYYVQKCKFLNR